MGERNYKLILAYDGTRYRGWQRLPGGLTIQGKVESALSEIFNQPIEIHGSGRTDAGVHAGGQVVSFTAPEQPTERVLRRLRHILPEDIGALELSYAPARFHARLSAVEKTYVYRIWNSEEPDVFGRRFRVQFPQALDLQAMREGASRLCGKHDFLAFCANKHFKKSSVRTLHRCDIIKEGSELRISMTGDGFLYHMARIMVGTLLEIGQGNAPAGRIDEIFASRSRETAGETAPAKGLCLMEVRYE